MAMAMMLAALSACGFHLRGALDLPAAMNATYIEYAGSDIDIRQQVARQLAVNGVSIVSSREAATAILKIPSFTVTLDVLSKNAQGRPQEYRVQVALSFLLFDGDGNSLLDMETVTRETVLALDPKDPLGARVAIEESTRTLRKDAVREMLQQISSLTQPDEVVPR